jgi:hypothetical protein
MLTPHLRKKGKISLLKGENSLEFNTYSIYNHHSISNSTITQTFMKNTLNIDNQSLIINKSHRSGKRNIYKNLNINFSSKNDFDNFESFDTDFTCDKVRKIRLKLYENLKDQKLFMSKIHKKKNNRVENFYTNSLLDRKNTKSENISIINFNNNYSNYQTRNNSESISFTQEIRLQKFLPSLYEKEYKNIKLITNRGETIQTFKNSVDALRKSKIKSNVIDEVYKTESEKIERENTKINLINYNFKKNRKIYDIYNKTFGKFLLELNRIESEEYVKLYQLFLEKSKKKKELQDLKFKIQTLINKKKQFIKVKILLFQMKYNIKDLSEIKDKNLLSKYGLLNVKKIYEGNYSNKFYYYDNTNDNSKEYIPNINPPIFEDLNDFDEIFKRKQMRILDLCIFYIENRNFTLLKNELDFQNEIYNNTYDILIDEINLKKKKLSDKKFHFNFLLDFKNNLVKQFQISEKENLMIDAKNKILNIIKIPLIQNYAIKHFHLNYDFLKVKEVYGKKQNILIDSLLFFEKLINGIMEDEKKYKSTEEKIDLYFKAKKKYSVIKGIMKNKKFVEEMKIKRQKEIETILSRNNKILFKPIHKIDCKPKLKPNVKIIKNKNININEEDNNFNDILYN